LIRYGHFQAATTCGPQVADDLQAAYVIDDPHSVTYASAEMLTRIAPTDSGLYRSRKPFFTAWRTGPEVPEGT
jgi:hypothetical protein